MSIKIEVFVSDSCPHCPMAVQVVNKVKEETNLDLDVEVVNVADPANRERALNYKIYAVPSIAINENIEFVGAPSPDQLVSKLNEMTN